MAETLINNNQLNLGDLSGAYVELSQIVTAGKKKIVESLTAKGVTNITYTDTLTKMSEGIDALETNGVGGVNPNFPLIFCAKNMSTYNTNQVYDVTLPNKYICYYNDKKEFIDIYPPLSEFNLPTKVTAPQNTNRKFRITRTEVSTACGQILSTPFNIINIPNTNDFVAFAAGKIIKITLDYINNTIESAVAVDLVPDETSSISAVTGNGYMLMAADNTTNKVLLWTANNAGKVACVDINTGTFHTDNTSTIFWKSMSSYISDSIQPLNNYSVSFASSQCFIIHINWENVSASSLYGTTFNSNGSDSFYNESENKMYFMTSYTNNTCNLITFDFTENVFDVPAIINNISNTGVYTTNISSYSSHLFGTLCIINIPNTDYRLFLSCSYSFVLDSSNNIIPYIDGTDKYCGLMKYDTTMRDTAYTFGKIIIVHINDNIYALYYNSNYSYCTVYKIDIVYNKVFLQKVTKNDQTLLYGWTNIAVTESNINGGPFDATNITIPIDVSTD